MLVILISTGFLHAEPGNAPGFCIGKGRGWFQQYIGGLGDRIPGGCYGARQPMNSIDEARKLLEEYYAERKDVVIGRIEDRRWGFDAEILDRNNKLIDRVMVHRRTGRIRSMY